MCLARYNIHTLDPKTRRIWACGNFCLFTSIALAVCVDAKQISHPALLHDIRGLLALLSVAFFVWLLYRMKNHSARD